MNPPQLQVTPVAHLSVVLETQPQTPARVVVKPAKVINVTSNSSRSVSGVVPAGNSSTASSSRVLGHPVVSGTGPGGTTGSRCLAAAAVVPAANSSTASFSRVRGPLIHAGSQVVSGTGPGATLESTCTAAGVRAGRGSVTPKGSSGRPVVSGAGRGGTGAGGTVGGRSAAGTNAAEVRLAGSYVDNSSSSGPSSSAASMGGLSVPDSRIINLRQGASVDVS